MELSNRISRLGIGSFHRNDKRKQSYKNFSKNSILFPLIDLSLGSTDLLPPEIVINSIRESLLSPNASSYCLHAATKQFRETVAEWCKERFGVSVDPNKEVLLLIGSQEGTAHLPLALLDVGQKGLILDPSYPSHQGGMKLAGAHIKRIILKEEENWQPNFSSLSKSELDQIKLFILGYPHNPTAQVGKQNCLDNIMLNAHKYQFVVAHDNPYVDLALEGEAPVLLKCSGWREWGIEFFSFSKAWNMGGLRLGFAVGSEQIIGALQKVKGVVDFNQSIALQCGAISALSLSKSLNWNESIKTTYRGRRDKTIDALRNIGWNINVPSMAMYLWLPVPEWAKSLGWTDERFSAELLENKGVAIAPGSGFGEGGSNWLRMALVRPLDELLEAATRINEWWDANI